jgi:hypothetical protein
MLALALIALSMAQAVDLPDLEQDYLAMFGGSPQRAVTIIATYEDGRPYQGAMWCEGWWIKYADEETAAHGYGLPFRPDARGAIVMNPRSTDEPFSCFAGDGSVLVDLASSVYRITVTE